MRVSWYLFISARSLAGSRTISKRPLNGPITISANVSDQKYRNVPGAWGSQGQGVGANIEGEEVVISGDS